MAFSWNSTITAGDTKILAEHANEVRNNANILLTLMTANTGKCSNYSCSSLSMPSTVSTDDIIYTSWLTGIQSSVNTMDNSKYCAQAFSAKETNHCPSNNTSYLNAHKNTNYSNYHQPHNTSNLTSNNSTNCGTVRGTYHGTYS